MTNEEAISTLKEYNRWRRGKGRKYSHPGFPFDVKKIGETLDYAAVHLGHRLDHVSFCDIVEAASLTLVRMRKSRRSIMDSDATEYDSKLNSLADSVRKAKKIVAYIRRSKNG